MSVKVIRGRVDTGEKEYSYGEVISGLSDKDEKELVDLGVCSYVVPVKEADGNQQLTKVTNDLPEGLKEVAKNSFELPNGVKVKGRAKAIEALEAYNRELAAAAKGEGEVPDGGDAGDESGPNTNLPGIEK